MATLNAAFRRRLESSDVYKVIPVSQRQTWISACLALGEEKTRKPGHEEIFKDPDDCADRIFHWGFTEGCIFVKGRHRSGPYPGRWYWCKHHGKESRNDRGLESQVRKDDNGDIVGSRSRERKTQATDCPVEYYLSLRKLTDSLSNATKAWYSVWKNKKYRSHEDPLNLLVEKVYKKILLEY